MPKLLLVSISRSLKPNLLLWEEAPLWYGSTSFVFRVSGVWKRSCPRDLFPWFPWANHCCRIATWQNRKWLHFPASCSDWEQAYLLDDTPHPLFSLLSRGPSTLFSFPDLVGCTAVAGGHGRVNCCAQGSKYRVKESGVPSLRGDHLVKIWPWILKMPPSQFLPLGGYKTIFFLSPSVHCAASKNSHFFSSFRPQVCSLRHVQWDQNYCGCSCSLMSLQPPPTLCLSRPLFWKQKIIRLCSAGLRESFVMQ